MALRSRLRPRLLSIDDDTYAILVAVGRALSAAGISDARSARGASAALRWIVRDWQLRGGWERVVEIDRERERREGR